MRINKVLVRAVTLGLVYTGFLVHSTEYLGLFLAKNLVCALAITAKI